MVNKGVSIGSVQWEKRKRNQGVGVGVGEAGPRGVFVIKLH